MDREYVVTLYRKEDLEQFYNEMKLTNFPLVLKRPLSRNTHYMMTEEQAERLRQDPRVWGVERVDTFKVRRQVNREPYAVTGNFWKDSQANTVSSNDLQWGHIHCAGNQAQRGKGQFGSINAGDTYEQVNDSVEVFSNGKHVDVVIVDDPIGYDGEEWYSPTTNQTRFVQYQWFNELNSAVGSIDDDGQTLPTGTITYGTVAATPEYHGNHVCGTACGQHYGWAREANIYNMAVTASWPSGQSLGALLIFDYLRAFHLNKPINTTTGKRNPTITNHSYGGIYSTNENLLSLADVSQVIYRGVTYNSSNPGPSGWSENGIATDFGVSFFGVDAFPAYSSAVVADVEDAIEDGVVIIGASGNDNLLMAEVNDQDWDNRITISGIGTIYYHRGAWPNTPDSGSINVNAISHRADFRRAVFTNYGPGTDVFAPGVNILSAYNSNGLNDSKYSQGSGNYFYPINGTSMASPQVCGVIACVAGGKTRFTQDDARKYLNDTNIQNDMTFDLTGGGFDDDTCSKGSPNKYLHAINPRQEVGFIQEQSGERTTGLTFPRMSVSNFPAPLAYGSGGSTYTFTVGNSGSSHYVISGTDSTTTHSSANDPRINCNVGDTLVFDVVAPGHPFWIKTSATTGFGTDAVTQGTISGQGESAAIVQWDTTGVTPGTYYYICEYHSGMVGQIVVS